MIKHRETFLDALIDFWSIRNGSLNIAGIYRAKVIDNKDPLRQNRVKVFIPELMVNVKGIWARPLYNFKKVAITPEIGDVVLVTFENGNIQQPVYIGHSRLSCPNQQNKALCGTIDDKEKDVAKVPQDFWILETPKLRRLRFDDNDNKQLIQLGSYYNSTLRYIEIDDVNKIIRIHSDTTKRLIEIDDKNNIIKLHGQNGTRYIHIDDNSQKIQLKTSQANVVLDDSGSKIEATIGSSKVEMTPSTIVAQTGNSTVNMTQSQIAVRSNLITLN